MTEPTMTALAEPSTGEAATPIVVLCRTQLGENIGTAARAMLNFGLTELRLVQPACGWPSAKAVVAASGAYPVLNRVRVVEHLETALGDVQHVFATTARAREMHKPVLDAAEAMAETQALINAGRRVAILFGPERTGLANQELLLADALVSYPVNPAFASLNLAQAVLLLAYEWHKLVSPELAAPAAGRRPVTDAAPGGGPASDVSRAAELSTTAPATKAEVAGLVQHLVDELDAAEFFRSPDRRASLIGALTILFERRRLTRPEVHLLRGVVKDLSGGRRRRASVSPP